MAFRLTQSGQEVQDDLDLVENSIGDAFSTSSTYAVGDLVIYDNKLWRCHTAVSSVGAWTGTTNWAETQIVDVLKATPSGGTAGQVLKKKSNTDYNAEWANESGGGITNLLLNSSFKINQRENTSYTNTDTAAGVYSVDRWRLKTNSTATQDNTTLKWAFAGTFEQEIENFEDYQGLNVTASLKWVSLTGTGTMTINDGVNSTSITLNSNNSYAKLTHSVDNNATKLVITINATSITPKYCKLEVGEYDTLYIPRQLSEELWLCQRYYTKINLDGQTGNYATALAIQPLLMLPNTLRTTPTIIPIDYPLIYGQDTDGNFVKYRTNRWQFKKMLNNSICLQLATGGNETTLNFKQYNFYCLKNGSVALDAELYIS